jgi:hypothetical protein
VALLAGMADGLFVLVGEPILPVGDPSSFDALEQHVHALGS